MTLPHRDRRDRDRQILAIAPVSILPRGLKLAALTVILTNIGTYTHPNRTTALKSPHRRRTRSPLPAHTRASMVSPAPASMVSPAPAPGHPRVTAHTRVRTQVHGCTSHARVHGQHANTHAHTSARVHGRVHGCTSRAHKCTANMKTHTHASARMHA